ncbi:hypothetical protein PHJA_002072300 [Phtheirospermum japonicum]|uniref:AMP-activated protein kinase glycogen-binding domain-containing protein n=1 Tax=Phtheirospermum japonicum TaxID=374723 RepID=A0A830CLZ6_9LAMI|nr:hypothetical protein PHJA_002072300 [Phtheirospermum japonicum]
MAMAILFHFPIFHSLSSHKLSFCSSHFTLPNSNINYPHKCCYSTIVASSIKKSTRTSRKVRSDADLYNDIRDFLSTAGLPENHVPTMKELSQCGRQDLANVVRRRGYKFIKQLLTSSSTENIVRPNIDTGLNGNLEVLGDSEGSGLEITNEKRVDDHVRNIESEDSQGPEPVFNHHEQKELMISSSGGDFSNGSVPSSVQEIEDPGKSCISTKEQTNIDGDKDLNDEKVENKAEIRRLKFLLHQKELELTQLKEQIEKEKVALSLLQTKAETEINIAYKLISQKETELHAAEETLSGLKEVEVEYSGDGDTVELAGSFNGWDHKITMDLQPSSSSSSSSRLWRAVLWLYPGVYEIKFIIDGHWRVDPQRESISWNGVHNNILRVDR